MIKENSLKYNPDKQLELLRLQCKKLSPELYRINALYLQLLRSALLNSVRQAVYLLITDHDQAHLGVSSLTSRKLCLQKIDELVSKCNSLMTIESLMHLSEDLEKENNKKLAQNQKQILDALNSVNDDQDKLNSYEFDSIDLSSKLPLEDPDLIYDSFVSAQTPLDQNISFESRKSVESKSLLSDRKELKEKSKSFTKDSEQVKVKNDEQKIKNLGLEAFRKLLMNVGSSSNPENDIDESSSAEKNNIGTNHKRDTQAFLPDNPTDLLKWMNSLEIALIRRLRNLSNSINVELLGTGLINNLVPVNLLDAVSSGQINSKDAPSNLLRINVPVGPSLSPEEVDLVCLFIRPSELEFDCTRLRKCRNLLLQHRSILIKMIRQHRHWHSRSLANEVSQQWFETPLGEDKTKTT